MNMFLKKKILVGKLPSCPFLVAGLLDDKRMLIIKVLVRANDLSGVGYPARIAASGGFAGWLGARGGCRA